MQGALYKKVLKHFHFSTVFFQKNENFWEMADKKNHWNIQTIRDYKFIFKSIVTTLFKHLYCLISKNCFIFYYSHFLSNFQKHNINPVTLDFYCLIIKHISDYFIDICNLVSKNSFKMMTCYFKC